MQTLDYYFQEEPLQPENLRVYRISMLHLATQIQRSFAEFMKVAKSFIYLL